jgi:glycosyltransferase involved in cell wall biosynthesis
MKKKVTIFMPVYNGARFLAEAIESILSQTFTGFEFIIIDDGSTDNTWSILKEYKKRDKRLIIKRYATNLGLSVRLCEGRFMANGEYFARMDADDICLPQRIAEQVNYLDRNQEISICGTWADVFDGEKHRVWKYPLDHDSIYARMLFGSALVHPSVMMRLSDFNKHDIWFDANVKYGQDYELWSRSLEKMRFANIPYQLIKYRIHEGAISSKNSRGQQKTRMQVYRRFFDCLHLDYSPDDLFFHGQLATHQYGLDEEFLTVALNWFEKITQANHNTCLINATALDEELSRRWTLAIHRSPIPAFRLIRLIYSSSLRFEDYDGILKILKSNAFVIKRAFAIR